MTTEDNYRVRSAESEEGQLEKIDVFRILDDMWIGLKRFWLIDLLIVVLCSGAGYMIARLNYTPSYRAYTTFTVSAKNTMGYSKNMYNNRVASQLGAAFPYILTSSAMKQIICSDLNVSSVPGTIHATALEDTNLITLSVTSDNGETAYKVLQSVIKNYPKISEYVTGDVTLDQMDESGVPASPTNPFSTRRAVGRGAGIGILFVLAHLLIYAATRRTVRRESDLKQVLNVSVAGIVPHVRLKQRSKNDTMMINNKAVSSNFLEAIRGLRSRFEAICRKQGIKTVLVTGSVPGEGKTTVVCNLALSLSHRGFRVLLVDGDLRNPSVLQCLGMSLDKEADPAAKKAEKGKAAAKEPVAGLSDYLLKGTDPDELVRRYRKSGLFILPGGKPLKDTASALGSPQMKELLHLAEGKFDYILVDTPPCAVVSDASILAQYAGGILYVVRQDYAKVSQIQDGADLLSDSSSPIVGSILNDAEAGVTGYGYGYGYGYSHYGYGNYGGYGHYGHYSHYGDDRNSAESAEKPADGGK